MSSSRSLAAAAGRHARASFGRLQRVAGAPEPDGVWLFQSDDRGQVWVVQTREQAEREVAASRLTGLLVLCAPEAGGVRDVLVALRMFPPDLGTPPPEVIRQLQAAAQTEARFEDGEPV